jgi:hypothetical protein
LLIEEKLVLVTTARQGEARPPADNVFVDWGPDFAARHNLAYPELSNAGTFVGLGPLGLQCILDAGGTGYFRLNVVRRYSKSKRLRIVPDAAEFAYPAYAVYSENADARIVTPAVAGLKHVASSEFSSRSERKAKHVSAAKPRQARPAQH